MNEKINTLLAMGPFALRPYERIAYGRGLVSGEALIAKGSGNVTIAEFEDAEYAEAILGILNDARVRSLNDKPTSAPTAASTNLRDAVREYLRLVDAAPVGGAMDRVFDVGMLRAILRDEDARAIASIDWTVSVDGPDAGRCNTSPEFVRLSARVSEIIRDSAHALIQGDSRGVGGLIMAQLAHVENVGPR